jgi:hypothetical protein
LSDSHTQNKYPTKALRPVRRDDTEGFFYFKTKTISRRKFNMAFFNSAVGVLQTLVIALGAGLGIWGAINLLEGYGNDNPGAKSQGMKQLMAGGGVALIGITLVPLLSGLFG